MVDCNRQNSESNRISNCVAVFAGQGSQYYQMAKPVYDRYPDFRENVDRLDLFVQRHYGYSIVNQVFSERRQLSECFDDLKYTHPAIYITQCSLANFLKKRGVIPAATVGSSLGEIVAAVVAGCIDEESGLRIVLEQVDAVIKNCAPGGMVVVLEKRETVASLISRFSSLRIASSGHGNRVLVSGSSSCVNNFVSYLKKNDFSYSHLPVSYGFHSDVITPAKNAFLSKIASVQIHPPKIGLHSACFRKRMSEVSLNYFWEVVAGDFSFDAAIRSVSNETARTFIDVGPSGSDANIIRKLPSVSDIDRVVALLSPWDKSAKAIDALEDEIKVNKLSGFSDGAGCVCVFPGQGSQFKGMGRDVLRKYPDYIEIADSILGYSISSLCENSDDNRLIRTEFTQPALFVVCALSYLEYLEKGLALPSHLAGHSLGEYTALFAAGVFDFETGIKLVKKRGELMAKAPAGRMAALVNVEEKTVKDVLKEYGLSSIDLANFNSHTQFVISGLKTDIESAEKVFAIKKIQFIPLNVTSPFHSRYMQEPARDFYEYLNGFTFNSPAVPVVSNVTARPFVADKVGELLAKQIMSPVQWTKSIQYLESVGSSSYSEIGPGNVLSKLIVSIRSGAASRSEPFVRPGVGLGLAGKQDRATVAVCSTTLGSNDFQKEYNVRLSYVAGAMYKGIASTQMVIRMAKAGLLSFYGSGGVSLDKLQSVIHEIKDSLKNGETFGMNLLCNMNNPDTELETVELFIRSGISVIEAAGYTGITRALAFYRIQGIKVAQDGRVYSCNRIIAKLSRPEVAKAFLSPAPARFIQYLLETGAISDRQAALAAHIPLADDICVESDSGGHTDGGVALVLLPSIIRMRDMLCSEFGYSKKVRVGAAGGIGSPEAIASLFVMGAEFVLTGSINQCTVEADTSSQVKDILQQLDIGDTAYAPAGDMFEMGARVQVAKKGLLFPVRANKLFGLWQHYPSWDAIDASTRSNIEARFFGRRFDEVYRETESYYCKVKPSEIERAKREPKHKLALVFRWYFIHSMRLALSGSEVQSTDYQIHTGPSLGAFNQWVRGTKFESWRNRHVDEIACLLMDGAAKVISNRLANSFVS